MYKLLRNKFNDINNECFRAGRHGLVIIAVPTTTMFSGVIIIFFLTTFFFLKAEHVFQNRLSIFQYFNIVDGIGSWRLRS